MKRPSLQFYPADWRSNSNLRRRSWAARGAWIEVICLMHDSDEYGILRWPLDEIALAAGCPTDLLRELAAKGVLKGSDGAHEAHVFVPRHAGRDGDPVTLIEADAGPCWYSSRMVDDEHRRSVRGNSTRFTGRPEGESASPCETPKAEPKRGFGDGLGAQPKPTPTHRQGAGASSSSSTSYKNKHLSSGKPDQPAPPARMPATKVDAGTKSESIETAHESSIPMSAECSSGLNTELTESDLCEVATRISTDQEKSNSSRFKRSDENEPNTKSPPADESDRHSPLPAGFNRWWTAWPAGDRKTAKTKCAFLWAKHKLERRADELVAKIESLKSTKQWREGFAPAPLTYLNQLRFDDDTAPVGNAATGQTADWWTPSGFRNRYEAENEGCTERTAHLFRDGKRTEEALA